MPSLILTGYPSSGKSTVAELLKERALLLPSIQAVEIINEATACPDWTKQECYATSLAEKQTRAALKSAFDRAVATSNKKTLVVLDSLNYIKGFRYELHCLSKAAGERHGILWVLNRASVVEEWNEHRPVEVKERESYSRELLSELIARYEPPDDRNRWDKPCYTVDVATPGNEDSRTEAVKKSVYNMHALGESMAGASAQQAPKALEESSAPPASAAEPKKPAKSAFSRHKRKTTPDSSTVTNDTSDTGTSPAQATTSTEHSNEPSSEASGTKVAKAAEKSLEMQLDEILHAFLSSKELKQGASTQQHIAVSSNVLSEMDAITTRLVSAIASAQTVHTGGKLQVAFAGTNHAMNCPRMMALPELRRLRRQYLQWVSTHPPGDTSEDGIAKSFLKYLEEQFK